MRQGWYSGVGRNEEGNSLSICQSICDTTDMDAG